MSAILPRMDDATWAQMTLAERLDYLSANTDRISVHVQFKGVWGSVVLSNLDHKLKRKQIARLAKRPWPPYDVSNQERPPQ